MMPFEILEFFFRNYEFTVPVVLVVLVIWYVVRVSRSAQKNSEDTHLVPSSPVEIAPEPIIQAPVVAHEMTDEEFEAAIAEIVPVKDRHKSFYIKVAGTSHKNADGTSRREIIEYCGDAEFLSLEPEPENEYDPNAIAVVLERTGEQLGYLDSRLAGEVTRDQAKNGPRWIAFFRHETRHPVTDEVRGAVIYMIRFTDECAARLIEASKARTYQPSS